MLRLAGAALLMAVSTPAYASDWYFVAADEHYANISFIDKDSIHATADGNLSASMFSLLAKPEDNASAYRFEIEVNCGKQLSRLVSAEIYDEAHQPQGDEAMDGDWSPIAPDTQGAYVSAFICSKGQAGPDNVSAGHALPFDTGMTILTARSKAK